MPADRKTTLFGARLAAAWLLATLLCGTWLAAGVCAAWAVPGPPRLKQKTLDAFELYARLTETRNDDELRRGAPFLWIDGLADAQRQAAYAQLRRGGVKTERLETLQDGKRILCPDGLIHHWVGVIFIPSATLEQTLHIVQNYDHHATYYTPDVMRSKILERHGNDFKVFLRFLRKKGITVVLNTEHEIHYFPLDATHAYSRSRTTRVAQVEHHDTPEEREKPVGDDGGYLWRIHTYWRFVERDGGTYVQCESVSLTRDIPTGLGWLIGPFVNSIPRESLTFTLTATRAALARTADKSGVWTPETGDAGATGSAWQRPGCWRRAKSTRVTVCSSGARTRRNGLSHSWAASCAARWRCRWITLPPRILPSGLPGRWTPEISRA